MTARPHPVVWLLPFSLLSLSALFSATLLRPGGTPAARETGEARSGEVRLALSRHPGFAFGFRNLLADVTWLEAVQVSGARRMASADYDRLDLLLRTVNDFDPRFIVPYLLGGIILGDSPDHVPQALATLARGQARFPGDWRFPFYTGYIEYFSNGDPLAGARALEKASRIPGSPPYLPLLAARMFAEGREPETALAFLRSMAEQETNPARREALVRRMRDVVVERDIQSLERAVEAYRRGHAGAVPPSPEDLVAAGLIRRVPPEPHGGRYLVLPDGSVRSDRVTGRLKVFRPK